MPSQRATASRAGATVSTASPMTSSTAAATSSLGGADGPLEGGPIVERPAIDGFGRCLGQRGQDGGHQVGAPPRSHRGRARGARRPRGAGRRAGRRWDREAPGSRRDLLGQGGAQAHERPAEPGLHGSHRHVERRHGLGLAELGEVPQGDHLPVALGQRCDRIGQPLPLGTGFVGALRDRTRRPRRSRPGARPPTPPGA